jgi:hypothetical protein
VNRLLGETSNFGQFRPWQGTQITTKKNDWAKTFNVSCILTQVIGSKYIAQ